ncbi:MAG: PH domain-containing protein [Salinibacterium sp.]|nr:PH domain-containing protein [Salinibacterium sp.]
MRFAPTIFRPAFGRVLSVIVVVIAASGLAGYVVAGDLAGLVRYGWGLLLLAAVALALFWFPRLGVAEHEVTVRNVFSTVHLPWPAITLVDTKWALTLHTADRKVTVWASPAPNRYASQAATRSSARVASSNFAPRPGDLLETQSGAAAFVIRHHWEDLRADGLLDAGAEPGSVRRDIHWVTITVLAVLAAATAVGILL